jgi:predicted MFS family arabinose efflux permease
VWGVSLEPSNAKPNPLWKALSLSLGAAVALGFARFAYALLLPAMRQDLGWNYTLAGGMNTANAAGYLLGSLLAAPCMARLGVRRSFTVSIFLTALALLACGFSQSYTILLLLRLLAGASGAVVFIGGGALAAQMASHTPGQSATVLGVYFAGAGIGIFLSGLGLPALLGSDVRFWTQAWILLGAASLVAWWVARNAANSVEEPPKPASGAAGALRWGPLVPTMVAYFFFALGYIAYMTFVVAFVRTQGAGTGFISLFWAVLGMAAVGGPRVWGARIQRSPDGSALSTVLLTLTVGAVLPLVSGFPPLMLVSAALFGASFLSVVTSITSLTRRFFPPSAWPLGIAVMTVVFAAGQTLGPLLSGALSDSAGGLRLGLGLSAGVLLVGAAVARLQPPPRDG